ncbi:MAG: cation:proton antiporter [Bacteroidales bacterium]
MIYYVLIALTIIILLSYTFDLTSKYTRIPGVLLLIATGILINQAAIKFHIAIPDLSALLPLMGTLGLILIVLEGSLDLNLSREKKTLIGQSVSTAIILLAIFVAVFSGILVFHSHYPIRIALLNSICFGIISSAVAIPAAVALQRDDREFVTYESSVSDIAGILIFDFIMANYISWGTGIIEFILAFILTTVIAVSMSFILAFFLHRINHHVKYVIITATLVLVYSLAKLIHMPSLLVVLIFGLILNNLHLFRTSFSERFIDFKEFGSELKSFKNITSEMTFLIRSFFFIMFGFYTNLQELMSLHNLLIALSITMAIILIRLIWLRTVLRKQALPLLFFAPRGLITILLFLSIPADSLLPFMNKGLVTQVIFLTIIILPLGNLFFRKNQPDDKLNSM